MAGHQQPNIYVQNSIRSRNYDFTPIYSELIGRLCAVESAVTLRGSAQGFCNEVMSAFSSIELYSKIDRVCLALRLGHSNELFVVDSWNSRRSGENVMLPNYRCFVGANSSVLCLREGEIRIYSDASRIAEAFESKERPVQRSLANVMRMGLTSGLCLPLHMSGELKGFLFMNSIEESLFDQFTDEDYAVLNILSMVAKLALVPEESGDVEYRALAHREGINFSSQLFDDEEFSSEIQNVTKALRGVRWCPSVQVEGDRHFIYSPATMAYLMMKVCCTLYSKPETFPLHVRVCGEAAAVVHFEVPISENTNSHSIESYRTQVKLLEEQFAYLKVKLTAGINKVTISIPYDPVYQAKENVFYSV